MGNHSILVVDDDREIRQLLNHHLHKAGMIPYEATGGREAIRILKQHEIDLIVLDLMMDDLNGKELLKYLDAQGIEIPVIMLSARQLEEDKIDTLGSGADDYVTKPFSPRELIARIQANLRRYKPTRQSDTISCGEFVYDVAASRLSIPSGNVSLTPIEGALMELFLREPGRVYTKEELFKAVWKLDQFDANMVNVYINHLRKKLEEDPSKPRHIETIWGIGYRFSGEVS